jgi:chromosome segregation ATPase
MLLRSRASFLVLALAGAPLLTGCQTAEIERLEASQAQLQEQVIETATSLEEARAATAEMTAAHAVLETELAAARADAERAAAEAKQAAKDAETAYEDLESDKHGLESHRDELVEWVNELLPLAEKQDERLQNLRDITDDIAKQVEEYRGLEFKRPFMRRLIHRDAVKTFMRRDMER